MTVDRTRTLPPRLSPRLLREADIERFYLCCLWRGRPPLWHGVPDSAAAHRTNKPNGVSRSICGDGGMREAAHSGRMKAAHSGRMHRARRAANGDSTQRKTSNAARIQPDAEKRPRPRLAATRSRYSGGVLDARSTH